MAKLCSVTEGFVNARFWHDTGVIGVDSVSRLRFSADDGPAAAERILDIIQVIFSFFLKGARQVPMFKLTGDQGCNDLPWINAPPTWRCVEDNVQGISRY